MESTNLDMDEIFDDNDGDEDVGAMQDQADIPDNTQDNTQLDNEDEAEKAEVLERLQKLSKGAAKKVVRRPQPKLDPTRLTGERGIPILPKLFENVKFKGRGHEASDLATIMRHMEHWGHRLFPQMPFDDVIERVEKLGSKKPVQTIVKKIRLDMPILDEDFVGSDPENEDRGEDDVARNMDTGDIPQEPVAAEDVWDEMIRDSEEIQATQERESQSVKDRLTNDEQPATSRDTQGADTSEEPLFIATRIDTPTTPVTKQKPSEPGGLTPDQLARIERKKQLALERRMKKMGQLTPQPGNT